MTPPISRAGRVILAVVCLYLGIVLILPLTSLLDAIYEAGVVNVLNAITSADARECLSRSLYIVFWVTSINCIFGTAAALVLKQQRFAGRKVLDALIDLPLAISPVMTGFALLLIFGRQGLLWPLLDAHGIRIAFSFPGLVIATLFVTLPFTVREVGYVLEEVGQSEEEAAATLGASPWQTFWHITLPNISAGLGFGITLTTARALGEFGAVLVIGGAIAGRTQTATTYVYQAMEERNLVAAYGTALVLAAFCVVLLTLLEKLKHLR